MSRYLGDGKPNAHLPWRLWHLDYDEAADRCRPDRRQYPAAVRPDRVPMVRGQHDKRQPPTRQVLLIPPAADTTWCEAQQAI
jgi:hypothetical protein